MNGLHILASRRRFLAGISAGVVAADATEPGIPESFPSHPAALVKEMVGVAHGNSKRVQELMAVRPTLANAAWDWGFGDWETALGAASHMGRRDIAEILLANGATPTLFSAAMLGQLDVVKAMIVARPGVERSAGPHGISLLSHARAGGTQSEAVVKYLQGLGDAVGSDVVEISEEELAKLTGEYVFGSGPSDRIEISRKGKQLTFTRKGAVGRPIHYVGDRAFRPAGARVVRIRFRTDSIMTIHDGDLIVTAKRL